MTTTFKATRLKLKLATWAQQTTSPNAGGGVAATQGSFWMRNGAYPSAPVELFLKTATTDTGWTKENLVNLGVYNVKDYGAIGDGVTDDRAAIQSAFDAANTAGGGVVYFPATANFYAIKKQVGQTDLISISGAHNVMFLGDGFASNIRQIGSASAAETHMFGIHNASSRIVFSNLNIDMSITNPDPADQNHAINIYGKTTEAGGPSDILVEGCYFGSLVGDGVRQLGESVAPVSDVRVTDCMLDAQSSRAPISAQRFAGQAQIHFNWITGSQDQQIDFEPTAGLGPHEWSIIGNIIDNQMLAVGTVTLSGAGDTNASQRNIYAYNTIVNGGFVAGVAVGPLVYHGNFQELFVGNAAVILFEQFGQYEHFSSNIAINHQVNVTQAAFYVFSSSGSGSQTSDLTIQDNIVTTTSTQVGGTVGIQTDDINGTLITGNHVTINNTQINSVGIQARAINHNMVRVSVSGNMLFNDGAGTFLCGVRVTATNHSARNNSFNFNFFNSGVGATNGFRWETAGTGTITGWQCGAGNNGVGFATQMLSLSGGVTLEGAAGPGTQIVFLNSPILPESNVTAPSGSLCVDNSASAGQGHILNIKESGTGNTGWIGVGGYDVQMGALASTTATAARFFAPGGLDLSAESTTEIQWVAPRPGTLRNLRITCTAGTGGGNNTMRVQKNGVASAPTATISNTNTAATGSSTTTVVAGDLVSFVCTKAVAPATPQTNIVATFELI